MIPAGKHEAVSCRNFFKPYREVLINGDLQEFVLLVWYCLKENG